LFDDACIRDKEKRKQMNETQEKEEGEQYESNKLDAVHLLVS
jgi:hypothetical protein